MSSQHTRFDLLWFAITLLVVTGAEAQWQSTGFMHYARDGHSATLLQDGRILVVGGGAGTAAESAEIYDPRTGRWHWLDIAPELRTARRNHSAVLLESGEVLIVGGQNAEGSSQCLRFDPTIERFRATGSLNRARYQHTTTLLPSGEVLAVGGQSSTGSPLEIHEIYDPDTGSWRELAAPTEPVVPLGRMLHAASLVTLPEGPRVLVTGGFDGFSTLADSRLFDPQTETWTPAGSLATARKSHTTTTLPGGRVLAVGGDGAVTEVELFDPTTRAWTPAASLGTGRHAHAAVLTPLGELMVIGGIGSGNTTLASVEIYDPWLDQWRTPASQALLAGRRLHQATLLADGRILVSGGNSGLIRASAEIHASPAGLPPRASGNLSTARRWHASAALGNGEALVLGGFDGTGNLDTVLRWSGPFSWQEATELSEPRDSAAWVTLPDGRIFLAGGFGDDGLATTEIYDPDADPEVVSPGPTLGLARYGHSATLLPSGDVLVVGGRINEVSDSVELCDPSSVATCEPVAALTVPRENHSATLLPDRGVLVVGGRNGNGLIRSELYDFKTCQWTETGLDLATCSWREVASMATPRQKHTATRLATGRILVVGGEADSGGDLDSVELYDPAADLWIPTTPLRQARYDHTATLLPSGQVLVIGGDSGSGPVASVELFDPSTQSWRELDPLPEARAEHTAVLLSSGEVLVVGGGEVGDVETYLYDPFPEPEPSRQPTILSVSSSPLHEDRTFGQGLETVIRGIGFRGDSEASSGGTGSSAVDAPTVRLQSLDGRIVEWLVPAVGSSWTTPDPASGLDELRIDRLPSSLDPGIYKLTVVTSGVASEPATVEVVCGLAITNPEGGLSSATDPGNGSVTFSVETDGGRFYQWYTGDPEGQFEAIDGAIGSTYTLGDIDASDIGRHFFVRVSNGCATVTSNSAELTVEDQAPPAVEMLAPNGGEYWLLSNPAGAPNMETVLWEMADDIRICRVVISLLRSMDGGSSYESELVHTLGGAPGCGAPGLLGESWTFAVPPEGSEEDGALYKFRVEVEDYGGNRSSAESRFPFYMVTQDPEGFESLVLWNSRRMETELGADASQVDALRRAITELADHPRVQGTVVDLGENAELEALYAAWDGGAGTANEVLFGTGGVHSVILQQLAVYSGIEHLVLVGDDRIIPMARLDDVTQGTIESSYIDGGDLTDASSVGRALKSNQYLSDDPLTTRHAVTPVDFEEERLFLPQLLVGRLVEEPEEIVHSITVFLGQNGKLVLPAGMDGEAPPEDHRVLVTGYDFLTDSAGRIRRHWREAYGLGPGLSPPALATVNGELIGGGWGPPELLARLDGDLGDSCETGQPCESWEGVPFALINLNGHANHYEEGVPGGGSTAIVGLSVGEIYGDSLACRASCDPTRCPTGEGTDLTGSVIYAVGCHGGLPVPGSCVGDADNSLDLPQTFLGRGALAYAANSGFGWGLNVGSGLSERMVELFTEELALPRESEITVGAAIRAAKRRYRLEQARMDLYDEKTLMQWTLFGFPMLGVDPGLPVPASSPAPSTALPRFDEPAKSVAALRAMPEVAPGVRMTPRAKTAEGVDPAPYMQILDVTFRTAPEAYTKYDAMGMEIDAAGCSDAEGNPGCYYAFNDLVLGESDWPLLPFTVVDTRLAGTSYHGALWLGGSYSEEALEPIFGTLVSNGGPLEPISALPRTLHVETEDPRRRILSAPDDCRPSDTELTSLVIVLGELAGSDTDGWRHRLFDAMDFEALFYANGENSSANCDREAPRILESAEGHSFHSVEGAKIEWAVETGNGDGISVDDTWRVVVVYNAREGSGGDSAGAWQPLELVRADETGPWRGEIHVPLTQLTADLDYVIQAVDDKGNVAWLHPSSGELPSNASNASNAKALAGGGTSSGVPLSLPTVERIGVELVAVDMALAVTQQPTPAVSGEWITYGVIVRHDGTGAGEALESPRVELDLPSGFQLLFAGGTGWACDSGAPYRCRATSLAAGHEAVLFYTVTAPRNPGLYALGFEGSAANAKSVVRVEVETTVTSEAAAEIFTDGFESGNCAFWSGGDCG